VWPTAQEWCADVKHVTSDRRIRRYPLDAAGTIPGIEDPTDENAADGILVAQVRRLRTIYREVFRPAADATLITPGGESSRQSSHRVLAVIVAIFSATRVTAQ
jgi:hypothetical protein